MSEVPVKDFQIFFGGFNSTEISVTALTEAGREWLGNNVCRFAGLAPTSVNIRKSQGQSFLDRITADGLTFIQTNSGVAA